MNISRYRNNVSSSTFGLFFFTSNYLMILINFLLFSVFFSGFVMAMETREITFLNIKELYLGVLRNNSTEEEIKSFIKAGVALKLANPNLQKLQQTMALFKQAADQGDSGGMYWIGKICQEQGKLELAVRWYTLAFQNQWFKNPNDAFRSPSYNSLKALGNVPQVEIKNFLLIHTFDIDNPVKKVGRYSALINFYKNKTAESYLDEEENQLKIDRLERETKLVSDFSCTVAQNYYDSAIKMIEEYKLYEDAKRLFLRSSLPNALHNVGWLYEEGYIGKKDDQPDYQEAVNFYEMAKTAESFANLGRLYKNGTIGKVGDKPNYEKAAEYLKCSGHSNALRDLGILFKEGYVGQIYGQPDYQTARSYLEKSKSKDAYIYLEELCLQGHIGNNSPRPDYKQAELYLRQAASHGYSNALCKLGYLYLEGYIGTIDGNPDYKSAVKCLEEAAQSSDLPAKSNAFYNLGVLHVKGHVNHNGLPNYGRAVDCFMQSTMPEASYNIGNLYEEGYVKGAGYNEALEYYKKSNLPRAQIAMLGLYQLGRVKPKNENDKQEIIEDIVQKINPLLPTLPLEESYYIKGIAEYYLGNWEEAFISLQNALFLGNEEEGLSRLIEEIEEALEGQGEQERELKQKSSFPIPAIPTLEKKIEEIPEGKKEQKETMELPPEPGKETKQESNFPISTITPIKKETRENKISLIKGKVNKSKQSIFKPKKIKQKFLGFQRDTELKTPKLPQLPLRFQFLNHEDQDNFENLRKSNRKLQEILQDIEENCWATAGSGRPEVLKYPFKEHKYPFTEHKGCLSRRLNQGDRLVYKVIKPGVILVLSWEGHY